MEAISLRMLRTLGIACLAFVAAVFSGCTMALSTYNQASQEPLKIVALHPERYVVSSANGIDYPVAMDGFVLVDIPRLQRGCTKYLFGVWKLSDASAYAITALEVRRENHLVRSLSLNDLAKLPVDSEGRHLLKII